MQTGEDLSTHGTKLLLPGNRMNHDIIQENMAKATTSIRVHKVPQDAVGEPLEVGRTIGKAHVIEALVRPEPQAPCRKAGLTGY